MSSGDWDFDLLTSRVEEVKRVQPMADVVVVPGGDHPLRFAIPNKWPKRSAS